MTRFYYEPAQKKFSQLLHTIGLTVAIGVMSCGVNEGTSTKLANTIIPADTPGIDLGVGYDSLTGDARGECVTKTEPEETFGASGQTVRFSLQKVEDFASLSKSLGIDASASFNAGGAVSASMSFAKSVDINSYSIYVLVKVHVLNSRLRMPGVELNQTSYNLLEQQGPDKFREKCGDEFVNSFDSGGELYGIVQIKTKSSRHQKDISAEIAGSYGSFSASAEFEDKLKKIAKSQTMQVYVFRKGGPAASVNYDTKKLIKEATEFPLTIEQSPATFNALTIDYKTLDLPMDASLVNLSQQKLVVEKLAQYKSSLVRQLNDIDYILLNQNEFVDPNPSELAIVRETISEQINQLHDQAVECFTEYTKCEIPSDLYVAAHELPTRKEEASCNNPVFLEKTGEVCGVKSYNTGIGSMCSPARYKVKRHASCGVLRYKVKAGASCGVKTYNSKKHKSCGNKIVIQGCTLGSLAAGFGLAACKIKCNQKGGYLKGLHCRSHKTCSKPEFGVKEYNTCRHAKHGAETYKSCRKAAFGVESFNACANAAFGVKEYKTCRHESFGIESCGS